MRFSSSEEELSTLIRVDKTRTLLSMQYISAFLFLPSTLVLLSYVATTVAGGSGHSLLEIESIDIGVDWAEKTRVRHDKIYGNEARHCVGY